jgi:hypothetical protein
LGDLEEHVFEADEVERSLLKGEFHHFLHYYDELLDVAHFIGETLELFLE